MTSLNTIIVCDGVYRANLCRSLAQGFTKFCTVEIVCTRFEAWVSLRTSLPSRTKIHLLCRSDWKSVNPKDVVDSVEWSSKYFSRRDVLIAYSGMLDALSKIQTSRKTLIIGLNGHSVFDFAIRSFAKQQSTVEHYFVDLTNVYGRLWVGRNTAIAMSADEEVAIPRTLPLTVDGNRGSYFGGAGLASIRRNLTSVIIGRIVDFVLYGRIQPNLNTIQEWVSKVLWRFKVDNSQGPAGNTPTPYVLFLGQTSDDAQILRNSNVSSLEAVLMAHDIAKERKLPLMIRPHPLDPRLRETLRIFASKHDDVFVQSAGTLEDAIAQSACVITINSSACLAVANMSKEIIFLGRSPLAKLQGDTLLKKFDSMTHPIDFATGRGAEEWAIAMLTCRTFSGH